MSASGEYHVHHIQAQHSIDVYFHLAGSGSASSSHTSGTSQNHGPTQNNNGCPPFPTNCRSECTSLDTRSGCPVCTCTSGKWINSEMVRVFRHTLLAVKNIETSKLITYTVFWNSR